MTDQSPNDVFHASSFLQGHNAAYIEQLYARYATDPNAVDEAWRAFFRSLGDTEVDAKREAAGPSWARRDWPPTPSDDLTHALDGQWAEPARQVEKIKAKAAEQGVAISDRQARQAVLDSIRALMIIRAYRIRGHLAADLDPLGMRERSHPPRARPPLLRLHRRRHGPADLHRQRARPRDGLDARDHRHREAHLLRHLRAPVHAHLRPRAGRLAQGADRGLRQGDRLHPRRAGRRS
jgi:2-oxoglutarate dehydrogenase complex dehydrogenase (E1) component-like enzyme